MPAGHRLQRGRGWGEIEMGKRGQMYGDRWKLDSWWEQTIMFTDTEL